MSPGSFPAALNKSVNEKPAGLSRPYSCAHSAQTATLKTFSSTICVKCTVAAARAQSSQSTSGSFRPLSSFHVFFLPNSPIAEITKRNPQPRRAPVHPRVGPWRQIQQRHPKGRRRSFAGQTDLHPTLNSIKTATRQHRIPNHRADRQAQSKIISLHPAINHGPWLDNDSRKVWIIEPLNSGIKQQGRNRRVEPLQKPKHQKNAKTTQQQDPCGLRQLSFEAVQHQNTTICLGAPFQQVTLAD